MMLKPPKFVQLNREHPHARGLVGCWLMNEGAGDKVADSSGNGNTGEFQGTAPSWSAGKFGPAIRLPGDDEYISCGTSDFGNPTEFTLVVNLTPGPTANSSDRIMARDNNYYPFALVDYGVGGGKRGYSVSYKLAGENLYNINTGYVIQDEFGNHQIVFICSSGNQQIFINAIPFGTPGTETGAAYWNGARTLAFGARPDGAANWWDGNFNYAMIYNRVLSPLKIRQLYLSPFCMFRQEPIERWTAAISGGPTEDYKFGSLVSDEIIDQNIGIFTEV